MMKRYIIFCSIAVLVVCVSVLFLDKYLKNTNLLGEVENTYGFSYDPPLMLENLKIRELSKFNQILAEEFPNHHIYATFSGEECNLTIAILHDYDIGFSDTDRKKLWGLVCKWTEHLWNAQAKIKEYE